MVTKINLEAKTRDPKDSSTELRNSGMVPAQVYGPQTKNKNLLVAKDPLNKAFALAGQSGLIDLSIDNEKAIPVIIKEVQNNPTKDVITHIDFYQVNLKQAIEVEIPINLVGEAKAVKDLGAMISKAVDTVSLRGLPTDLVEHLDVDISSLSTFEDSIKLSDLKLPQGLELVSEEDNVLISVLAPKISEEEEEAGDEGEEAGECEEKKEAGEGEEKPKEDSEEKQAK